MQLPDGDDGDAVIRGFYRSGRTIDVALYSDAACSTPAVVQGKSSFPVDIAGMPPVQSALASLAWGTLTPATVTALETFAADSGSAGSFTAAWTFADGVTGFDENTFCAAGDCGDGSDSRRGQVRIRPSARSGVTPLHASSSAIAAGDYKMFTLGGRDASGMNVESSFFSCTAQPAGQMCGMGVTGPVDGANGNNPGNNPGNGNGNTCSDPNGCPGNNPGNTQPGNGNGVVCSDPNGCPGNNPGNTQPGNGRRPRASTRTERERAWSRAPGRGRGPFFSFGDARGLASTRIARRTLRTPTRSIAIRGEA